jgi:predicted dehydrogenase/acetyltransferase-like isoleucine patch superfamily enzyme
MIALIGAGYWGKNLLRNFNKLGVLSVICEKDPVRIRWIEENYPGINITRSYSDVINNKNIKAVVISTPAEMHFYQAREALLSGKDVFVEKPLALNIDEAQELTELSVKNNLILMVGHLLQYHNAFIKLKELVSAGELGRVNYIYSNRLNLGKVRREENALWSFAPHDISMILTLSGDYPDFIYATGGNYLHRKIADITTTHLQFSSGLRAHIFVSWLHPYKEQKLVVVGDKKMAVFDDCLDWSEKLVLYPHEIVWKEGMPVPVKASGEKVELKEIEPLFNECETFLKCINSRTQPVTDGAEGVKVLQILNLAQESLEKGYPIDITNKINNVFVHESSFIDKNASIGTGTKIWHFSHILAGSTIGKDCNIGQNVMIGPDVSIGGRCKIQNNVSIYKGVTLSDEVFCGPSVVFTNVHNPRAHIRRMDEIRKTLVKKGASIGANSTIICGVTLGEYSFIGAGAVVTKDVPDYALFMGNPARQTGWMCKCGAKLDEHLICSSCGDVYELLDGDRLIFTKKTS